MNSLERLKEAAEHPGSYINGPDIALALEVIDAALELADLMEDVCSGDYTPDSFTTQPMRQALAALTEDKP